MNASVRVWENQASVVQLEQIRTIDKSRIDNYLGKVTPREMVAIEKALSVSLAMEQSVQISEGRWNPSRRGTEENYIFNGGAWTAPWAERSDCLRAGC